MGIRKKLGKDFRKSIFALEQKLFKRYRELITASCVVICVLLLRYLGLFQPLEWAALDQFFQWRSVETSSERITIVAIDEDSLNSLESWPISDKKVAELLQKISSYQPSAIGLHIYRNRPVEPGSKKLKEVIDSTPNLTGIESLSDKKKNDTGVQSLLSQKGQIGLNTVIVDADGTVRRGLLYAQKKKGMPLLESFALKLAITYLDTKEIEPKKAENSDYLQLDKTIFTRFKKYDGGYIDADDGGYQFLSSFPKPACKREGREECYGFRTVSLKEVLDGNNEKQYEDLFKNRIVLIGSTAPSLQDLKLIPYSRKFNLQLIPYSSKSKSAKFKPISGIELQAYFIDEIIAASLQERQLLRVWSEPIECLWIAIWAYIGAITRWRIRSSFKNLLLILILTFILIASTNLLFLAGWWVPLIPTLITYIGSVIFVTSQIAHMQEELKRSKEFLQQVINTVPDPIFVKNEKHQWIVLNDAYCSLTGFTKSELIDKLDYDFFPKHEADAFIKNDEHVFKTRNFLEKEEELTDKSHNLHLIATKRSLHKDGAGNLFLVGVIRDITERKRIEAELQRSNDELKNQEDHFRYIAYHDALTGLPNRKAFAEELRQSLYWTKNSSYLLALLFVDLDGFKQINDSLGHNMGDLLLMTVAQRLNNCLRGSDTVSRLGGDEFIIILRRIPNPEVAGKIADKILKSIMEPVALEGHNAKVSASIGISIYPDNAHNCETLVEQADIAMYRAKRLGKNRYKFAE